MSALTEKREEYSSNIVRILHPSHSTSPNANVKEMDSDLDYLLDDLQSSVYSKNRGQLQENVQYYDPSNTTIIVKEKSILPRKNDERQSYKMTSYQYTTDHTSTDPGKNVNQLDNLLEDLKSERDVTKERDYGSLADPKRNVGFMGDSTQNIAKSTHVYRTVTKEEKPHVYRELIVDPVNRNVHGTIQDSTNYVHTNNVAYEQGTLKSQSVQSTIPLDTVVLSDELKDVPLSDDILPVPGTKVTTTVRTYTYEIPAEPSSTLNKTLLYKTESYGTGQPTPTYHQRAIPSKIVIEEESHKTIDNTDVSFHPDKPQKLQMSPSPVKTRTLYLYNDTNIRDNSNVTYSPSNDNVYPPDHSKPVRPDGPTTSYYYKHESVNKTYGWDVNPNDRPNEPYNVRPPHDSPNYSLEGPTRPVHNVPPHREPFPAHPPEKINDINYKRSIHSSTMTTHVNKSVEKEPLLQPAPFPVDDLDNPRLMDGGNTPKHIDDLMASFNGNVERGPISVREGERKKEIETGVASAGEPRIPSKNITGPPVYYPPGHELFVRKEEGAAAYRAQGGYAKASGRYEYEAESKSKSKTRSGAAVVPVCLPLCCAMPCSIM